MRKKPPSLLELLRSGRENSSPSSKTTPTPFSLREPTASGRNLNPGTRPLRRQLAFEERGELVRRVTAEEMSPEEFAKTGILLAFSEIEQLPHFIFIRLRSLEIISSQDYDAILRRRRAKRTPETPVSVARQAVRGIQQRVAAATGQLIVPHELRERLSDSSLGKKIHRSPEKSGVLKRRRSSRGEKK